MAVKRLKTADLIPNKKYLFFTHTKKGQASSKELLKAVLEKNIELLDYECFENPVGKRLIGFGNSAGYVGAYNALLCYGVKNKLYNLLPAHKCVNKKQVEQELKKITALSKRLVFTGSGRVASGVKSLLRLVNYKEVSPTEYLNQQFDTPVFCNLKSSHYHKPKAGFENADFYKEPQNFEADFLKYAEVTDVFIASHYWNEKAPQLFELSDIQKPNFKIQIITDITVYFGGSIAATPVESTIANPFYDWDVPFLRIIGGNQILEDTLTVMSVANLPCELPKDASTEFGAVLKNEILPLIINQPKHKVVTNATITSNGKFTKRFEYLAQVL